ncbi:flagellar type III secretion system pore protein FliP [Chitinibacteraceae bacterium HSL-7]
MAKIKQLVVLGGVVGLSCGLALGASPSVDAPLTQLAGAAIETTAGSGYIRVIVLMTLLSLLPILLIAATSFTRILIVLSAVRLGLGMQQTPPNTVIITLALCLSMFAMAPVGKELNDKALQPYMNNQLTAVQFAEQAVIPIKSFMLAHVRDADLALIDDLASDSGMSGVAPGGGEIPLWKLMPAFMLSELRVAFQMAFVVLLPFLLIDLLVAVGLMSLGMMMVPPVTIALPIKILMFVLVDGWALLARSLVASYV